MTTTPPENAPAPDAESPLDQALRQWLVVQSLQGDGEESPDPAALADAQALLDQLVSALSPEDKAAYDEAIAQQAEEPVTAAAPPLAADLTDLPLPWHGVLAPEDVRSGDKRKFAGGALRHRDLPLPLKYQEADSPGHDGSVRVANIQDINRGDGMIRAWGLFDTSANADEAARQIAVDMLRGVSVDVDDAAFTYEDEDGNPVDGDASFDLDEPVMVVTDGRISGATLCSIPAFQEAYVALGPPPEEWGFETGLTFDLVPGDTDGQDDVQPLEVGSFCRWDGGQGQVEAIAEETATVRVYDGDEPTEQTTDVPIGSLEPWDGPAGDVPVDAEEMGALSFVEGVMPRKLKAYWTRGEGAAKIGWGTGGDFNRCRTNLAKYVPEHMLSGLCANLHHAATGTWPGKGRPHALEAGDVQAPAITATGCDCEGGLVASAAASDFANPGLEVPTPLTITEDGHVYGHLATFDTCHVGFDGQCVTPPKSGTGYAYFTTGEVETDLGLVPVGQITMGTGHAAANLGHRPAVEHYDNTGSVVCDVAAGDDDIGIWISGRLRDGVTEDQKKALRAGALSGDWRRIGGGLELVAALAVNVPGFPIPRLQTAAKNQRQVTLVASGIVAREAPPETTEDVIRRTVAIIRAGERRAARVQRLQAKIGRDKAARVMTASAVIHGEGGQ